MTISRLRESRSSGVMASYPNGYGLTDPTAIPPPGLASMQRAGVPVTVKTTLQVDTVYTALRVITNAIIRMGDPYCYTNGHTDDNKPYEVIEKVQPDVLSNCFVNKFQFEGISQSVVSMAIFGEAFWYVLTRDTLQYPKRIEVLNPALVDIKKNKNTGEQETWYGSGTGRTLLAQENVVHIPFLTLPGAARGLDAVTYGGMAFALALAAVEYGSRWFSQGASPSYILSTEQKLGTDEVKRIANQFLVDHAGLQAAHLPLVVDSGLKVNKVQSTPDEAQYLQTLQYARSQIAAWFGLPDHLVGGDADKGTWGKSLEEVISQFLDFTISGYVSRLNAAFSSLLPKGKYAKFDETAIRRANALDQAALILALRQTQVATPDDIRVDQMGWSPLPNGEGSVMNTPLASNVAGVGATPAASATTPAEDAVSTAKSAKDATGASSK
jgi:HK97 family phage portal protein